MRWVGGSVNQSIIPYTKEGGLLPRQGTHLGCRSGPWLECIWEATNQCSCLTLMFLSLSSSLPSSLSKNK